MTDPATDRGGPSTTSTARAAARVGVSHASRTPPGRALLLAIGFAVVATFVVLLLAVGAAADSGGGPVTDVTAGDVPAVAVDAYFTASAAASSLVAGCAVRPSVIAGIGRVESMHGTLGGSVAQPDGTVVPPIIGIPLDGGPGVAAIADTDGGRLDGDTTWDRAVGPMQFIPGSWDLFGVDGNGDGVADPHNLYDAAAAAVVHLCRAEPTDLNADPDALARALMSYNRSEVYRADVLAHAAAYDVLFGNGARPPVVGGASPQMLLAHPGFSGSAVAVGDLQAGVVDGRLIALLTMMADRYTIYVGGFKTGHSQCVGGGSRAERPNCTESHHYYGRGADVSIVAGTTVRSSNSAAYDLVRMLATTPWPDPRMAPNVGSPWPEFDPLPGFFHDSAHLTHLHVDVCGPRVSRGAVTDTC